MRRILLAAAALVALVACGSDSDGATPTTTSSTSTTTSATSTSATGGTGTTADPVPGATTADKTGPTTGPTAHLVDVRVARQAGFDRIVFEFREKVPGYKVGYVSRPITEDGSGRTITIDGAFVLGVRMEDASGADLEHNGDATYTGSTDIHPSGTAVVVELRRSGDFEGVLHWVAGTKAKARFAVTAMTAPPRLVIDVVG